MKVFNSVSDLQAASLTAGQLTQTKRYYAGQDGGGATYLIKTAVDYAGTPDGYGDHSLANGNVAVLQTEGRVDVKQFGATGDGVTDDTAALQAAIDLISKTDDKVYKLIFPYGVYKTSSVIYLPFGAGDYSRNNKVYIEGYGAELLGSGSGDANHDCFESAYWNSGVATTTVGTAGESHLTYGLKIKGLNFRQYRRVFYLQNWNQGTAIEDVYARNCQTAVEALRCFYMKLNSVYCMDAPDADTKPAFKLNTFTNIMPISGLKSSKHATVLEISGSDGLCIRDSGFEDCTDGVKITGEIGQLTFDTCYFEATSGAALNIDAVCRQLCITGSFINTASGRIIDASTLSSNQYASIIWDNNHYVSGDLTLDENVLMTSRNSPEEGSFAWVPATSNAAKVINQTPIITYDASSSGFNGAVRFVEYANVGDNIQAGYYSGSFGDTRLNTSNRVKSGTVVSASNPLTIDLDIDVKQNLFATVLIEFAHSTGTDRKNFFVTADGAETPTLEVFAISGGAVTSPAFTATDNGAGKLRITTTSRSGHTLINCIGRLI